MNPRKHELTVGLSDLWPEENVYNLERVRGGRLGGRREATGFCHELKPRLHMFSPQNLLLARTKQNGTRFIGSVLNSPGLALVQDFSNPEEWKQHPPEKLISERGDKFLVFNPGTCFLCSATCGNCPPTHLMLIDGSKPFT